MALKDPQTNRNGKQLHRVSPKLLPHSPQNRSTQPNLVHTSRPPHTTTRSAQQWPFSGPGPRPGLFLDFPGEIRNLIYGYVFPREIYEIRCLSKRAQSLTYTFATQPLKGPKLDPSVDRRRRQWDLPRRIRSTELGIPLYELSPGPAAILLTCKQIHEEASSVLYQNSTFAFSSTRAMSNFLNTIRISCKQSIRSLHLRQYTVGDIDREYSYKEIEGHDRKWLDLCRKVRDELCNLKELSIVLTINSLSRNSGEDDTWKAPLLAFSGIGLTRCSIILEAGWLGYKYNRMLAVEAGKLRQILLGENFLSGDKGHTFWFEKEKQQPVALGSPHRVLHLSAEKNLFDLAPAKRSIHYGQDMVMG